MAHVLENSASGERIVIRRAGAETAGELLEFDVFLKPGAHVPAGHSHPYQVEQFQVIAGRVQFRIHGRHFWLGPGSRLTVRAGTSHWFGNTSYEVAQLRVEVRPALRMQEVFERGVRCADSSAATRWVRLLDWLLMPLDFQTELGVPGVSPRLVAAILGPLAWLRRSLRAT